MFLSSRVHPVSFFCLLSDFHLHLLLFLKKHNMHAYTQLAKPQEMSDEGYLPVAGLSSDTKTVKCYPSLYITFLLRITCFFNHQRLYHFEISEGERGS